MAPRTIGGLAYGIAHSGHIRHENYEFIGIEGPAPAFAFNRNLDLHSGDLDPMVYDRHTLGTTLSRHLPRLVPSLATCHDQVFHSESQRPMAHGELTQEMALTGHILLGNHEIVHTNGSMPITSFHPT